MQADLFLLTAVGTGCLDDEPVLHGDGPLTLFCNRRVVRDDEERGVLNLVHGGEQGHDLSGRSRVEVSRRLIAKDDRRAMNDGTSHGHPLLLTARQF